MDVQSYTRPASHTTLNRWIHPPKTTRSRGRRGTPSKEKGNAQLFPTCHKEIDSFSATDDDSNLCQITLVHKINYPQMKSLDGFSDIQLGRYCFNLETEFSHRGFETLVSSSQASPTTIFSKMIIQQPSPILHRPFCLSLFLFPPLKYSFN